ncbi:GIY-YIG nuclease family protein [uncultured Alsobacter sp.]|uniref:GIY-YIG nuclease family protein n=1 Tax=uncultured Alsobacter sp. TaxID=1748258 RepID=UPI0025FCD0F8|nr:GIY-YIG nuclease family protein [uncultured Alsobacter sp.]
MGGYWLYILRCADRSLFVGLTDHDDPAKRVAEHNRHGSPLRETLGRRPVKLAFAAHFDSFDEAQALLKRIDRWSPDRLEDLIAGRCDGLLIASTAC